MYERVLVALDGSELAEQVLPYVEDLGRRLGSRLILLRVIEPPDALIRSTVPGPLVPGLAPHPIPPQTVRELTELAEAERREAIAYVERLAARLRGRGLDAGFEHPEGSAAETIVDRARGLGAGLIAMTTHGRSGFAHLFLGSVAEEVVRTAPCPVLLVRLVEH